MKGVFGTGNGIIFPDRISRKLETGDNGLEHFEYQTKPNFQWKVVLYYTPVPKTIVPDCFYFLFSEIAKSFYCDLKMVKNWKIGAFKYFLN